MDLSFPAEKTANLIDKSKERLESFGYEVSKDDAFMIQFCAEKVTNTIRNDCNVTEIPNGLFHIAVDMTVGEFLNAKRTFAPDSLSALNVDAAVKQLAIGDTSTTFAVRDADSPEAKLNAFIALLLTYGRGEFSCYRKLRW